MQSLLLTIHGLIQGIGLRPYIYNLAHSCDVNGYVRNRSDAVEILVQGTKTAVDTFYRLISESPPPLARIDAIITDAIDSIKDIAGLQSGRYSFGSSGNEVLHRQTIDCSVSICYGSN